MAAPAGDRGPIRPFQTTDESSDVPTIRYIRLEGPAEARKLPPAGRDR